MRYELIAIIAVIVCVVILCAEYLWLYILAERQEEDIKRHNEMFRKSEAMIEAVLSASTDQARRDEIQALGEFCASDYRAADMVCNMLLQLREKEPEMIEGKRRALHMLREAIDPVAVYMKRLEEGDIYQKSYACRKLADFDAKDSIEDIRKLLDSKKRDLSYNAAMSLSQLGDRESVRIFILRIENDRNYSSRIINELISVYPGDRCELVTPLLDQCGEYMQAVIIKAVAPYKLWELEDRYLEGMKSQTVQVKIACTKAVGALADPRHIHELILAANDQSWVVRLAAVKGLENFPRDPEALAAVKKAVQDKEWWVRQNAARSLINMDADLTHVESIIKGYDRYAADAMKFSLYRTLDLGEEDNT